MPRFAPSWEEVLAILDDNERRLRAIPQAEPMPEAEFCRQSAHCTLGHLAACQVAWLPLMRRIRDGAERGTVAVHPWRLFDQLGYATTPWPDLLARFTEDRAEWRELLGAVNLDHPLRTPTKTHTARTLTQKLVQHELLHLDDLQPFE